MYQVFEKTKDSVKVHNFTNKKEADKKHKELVKQNKSGGSIWDTKNNNITKKLNRLFVDRLF